MGFLSQEKLKEVIEVWNATQSNYPKGKTVIELFEEQALKTPEHTAIIFEDQIITYKDLNEKANQLAQQLKKLKVKPDQLIALFLEKSPTLIIAILATLKAGCAYLPLNIYDPRKYLEFILKDSQACAVITNQQFEANISFAKNIIVLDEQAQVVNPNLKIMSSSQNPEKNLAYVVYTSGTARNPKGVPIRHDSLVNYLHWVKDAFNFQQTDKFALLQSIFLDYSITEIFSPLTIGATLVIPPEHIENSPEKVIEFIKKNNITVIQQAPSHLKSLLDEETLSTCDHLKYVIVTGEPITQEIFKLFFDQLRINLYSLYGSAETTIHSTFYKYSEQLEYISPLIGKPINNTQCYLLNDKLELANIGDVADLYIGGIGVASGYLNHPELAAHNFIKNPFVTPDEVKKGINTNLFKTGDLGRYHLDGNIELVGRSDRQFKINGIRIQPEEIEAAIHKCTDVQNVLVTLREDEPGDKRIVAYIVPNFSAMRIPYHAKVDVEIEPDNIVTVETEDLSIEGICLKNLPEIPQDQIIQIQIPQKYSNEPLIFTGQIVWQIPPLTGVHFYLTTQQKAQLHRQYDFLRTLPDGSKLICPTVLSHRNLRYALHKFLPDYMVHSAAVWMEAFPLKDNGEIDISALPQPNYALREKPYIAPRNATEHFISEIMYELFKIKNISIDDSFLEMGGQSIIATQLISRLNKEYHIDLDLNEIFKNPTVAKIADIIESRMGQTDYVPLVHKHREPLMPLSFAEQRLWFIEQLKPDTPIYNQPYAFRIHGHIDPNLLETSFNVLIERHEILRTVYVEQDGVPYRKIFPELNIRLHLSDLRKIAKEKVDIEIENIWRAEASQPFHLASPPLIRLSLIQYSSEESIILFVTHHIISDGWSTAILLNELSTIYNGFTQDESKELKPLTIQYADFALWQKEYLSSNRAARELSYWQKKLSDAPELINLPTDFPRPAVIGYKGVTSFFTIPTKIVKQIKQYIANEKMTLFMFLLASLQTLLHRYTDDTDILVGTQTANRNREEIESIVGYFVNTLVIRGDLTENPRFKDFLKKIRDVTLAAYDHQNLPFEMLIDHLKIERGLSHSPLFQVMFDLQIPDENLLTFTNTTAKPEFITNNAILYDLAIYVTERPNELYVEIKFNADLYKPASIHKFFNHWINLITGILEKSDARLSELPLLTDEEKSHLLIALNPTEHEYQRNLTINQLFEQQVQRTPENTAVIYDQIELSYAELNKKANQLAHYLQSLQIKPGTNIAVSVERDSYLPIILLGILKAGCAYVPLDPSYPNERLEFIYEDANAQVLITQQPLQKSFKQQHTVINIDSDWKKIAKEKTENLNLEISSNSLAYIIYTSGSTGKPKGVLIYHQNTVNLLAWAYTVYSNDELSCALASTSINFDISVFEIFVPLTLGGSIVIAANLLETKDWWKQDVTIINAVPSVMKSLLELGIDLPPSVQTINLGGEPLSNSLAQTLYALPNIKKVYNLYGPSETTTYSTISLVEKFSTEPINIGKPIANTQIYLIDSHLNPVPLGCIGEIYIAGDGVCGGYLNRPELMLERFLENPFHSANSKSQVNNKLYKTGDLARYRSNGEIDYLGRNDFQVKIHGFRIELGEIENRLAKHPAVKECVIIAREDTPGDKRLVAYIVLNTQSAPIEMLSPFLKEKLPDYMIPKVYVVLHQFPLTATGKIDRKNLPTPEFQALQGKHIPPQTETEKKLAELWRKILNVDEVGIQDNFFEIGGHSLLVAQLAYHIRQLFNYKLSFVQFFSNPTIAVLASLIERKVVKDNVINTTLRLIEKDLHTARAIVPQSATTLLTLSEQPKTIFLTGVTGFLGIHLLAELIEHTQATIYCLARESKGKTIPQIFADHAKHYHFEKLLDHPRIVFVSGDMAKPQLDIKPEVWEKLTSEVDAIYHAAAYVHHLYDYATLRDTNVLGTIELLKFAAANKNKRFYYISTIWAALDKDMHNVLLEQFPEKKPTGLEDGYGLTKWTSEKILSEAKDRGFTTIIFRPSFILGHSETGVIPTQNLHILLLLKGCLQMGVAPKGLGVLDSVPVDFIAKSIIQISLQDDNQNKVFNCCHPKPPRLEQVFHWLRDSGFPLKIIPYAEWRDNYLSKITEENALFPIAALYLSEQEQILSMPHIISTNMKEALKELHIEYPKLDHFLFARYFAFLENWFRK